MSFNKIYNSNILHRKIISNSVLLLQKSQLRSLLGYKDSIFFKFSSNKFYQLVRQQKQEDLFHLSTEDNIITKFLKQERGIQFSPKQSKSHKDQLESANKKKQQINYKDFIYKNPNGSFLQEKYKQKQLLLIGLNYKNADWRNIYKTLYKFQPSVIIVQNRPQLLIQQFEILKKNKADNIFDDKLYLNQLKVKSQILPQNIKRLMTQNNKNRIKQPQIFDHFQVFPQLKGEIMNEKALLTSLFYSYFKHTDIYLGQIPQLVQRQWICNTHTLMELQQIFKIVMKQMVMYVGLEISPYQLASLLFPDKFLQINDKYFATLIEMLISLNHKKIAYFGGVSQNQAILSILKSKTLQTKNDKVQPIIQYLIPERAKGSIIRDIQGFQIIQKHILFDVMYYHQDILNLPLSAFKTTNKIIEHYGKKIYEYSDEIIMKFRYDTSLKYVELMKQKMLQSQKIKKKQFMRAAIRGN